MGQDIVLQEYIRESKGRDIRAMVVGNRVVAAMRRTAKAGEFSLELAPGRSRAPGEPRQALRLAGRCCVQCDGLEVAGVDMLEGRGGPKILEINSSPGLEGIERASGVDVATAIVKHAERFVVRHQKGGKRASTSASKGRSCASAASGGCERSGCAARAPRLESRATWLSVYLVPR